MRAAKLRSRMVSTIASVGRAQRKPAGRAALPLCGLFLLATCSGDHVEVSKRSGGLAASRDLAGALANRIVPAASGVGGGRIASPITGSANVGDDGATAYHVPVWVPDGVAGLSPALSIDYKSDAGDGLLGPRWQISGLSAITRCSQTLAQDGVKRSVDFSNGDAFCLDGVRLVRVSGVRNGIGEFRTERSPFSKIEVTAVGAGGALTFKVSQRGGHILWYGRTTASRLRANPTTFPISVPSSFLADATYIYYLDKIEDRFGNSVLVTYKNQLGTFTNQAQELVPTKIAWGATGDIAGQRSVTFNYEVPAVNLDQSRLRWLSGLGVFPGQRLLSLAVAGPNGAGAVVTLRTYRFSYTSGLTITGERLLTGIDECDANSVCKRPTSIAWEAGSTQFTRTDLNVTDLNLPGAPAAVAPSIYRRILVADLDGDGRDDIMYRGRRLGATDWKARLSTGTSLGSAIDLPVSELDVANSLPSLGDLFLADLNRDGFTDISYLEDRRALDGRLDTVGAVKTFLNSGAARGSLLWDPPVVALGGSETSRAVAIGDVDGDGFPELVRLASTRFSPAPPAGRLNAATVLRGSVAPKTIPDISQATQDFSGVDADGDGIVEILRDTTAGTTVATSPTMNGNMIIPPNSPPVSTAPLSTRWLLDFNGDGLQDIAYVNATEPAIIRTAVGTGRGFFDGAATTLPVGSQVGRSWRMQFDSGVRVTDFNRDGRQDLLLVDNGAGPAGSTRTNMVALLSTGTGAFTVQNTAIPVGDFADGWAPFVGTPVMNPHGYRTTVLLDFNGDGQQDVMQLESGRLVVYVRQGNTPDVVTKITEGTGRTVTAVYAPSSDTSVYTSDPASCRGDQQIRCVVRGMVLTKSLTIAGGDVSEVRTFTYADGLMDRGGRGFLGFKRREIIGPLSQRTTLTFDPASPTPVGNATVNGRSIYVYPFAFQPRTITTQVTTQDTPNRYHYLHRVFTPAFTTAPSPVNGAYGTFRSTSTTITTTVYDAAVAGAQPTGTVRTLGSDSQLISYDAFGNLVSKTVNHYGSSTNAWLQRETETFVYRPADTAKWLVSLLDQHQVTSVTPTAAVTRTHKVTPDLLRGGIVSVEIEPAGDASIRLLRTFTPDARGRLSTITDKSPVTGETRTTSLRYEDADGVYVTTTVLPSTGVTTLSWREWRHPGLGVLVETDDPNGIAAAATYDTFGRLVGKTTPSGAVTTVTYADNPPLNSVGEAYTVQPPGQSAVEIKLDATGREIMVISAAIDLARMVRTSSYDSAGRLKTAVTASEPKPTTANPRPPRTILNSETLAYDDLNRGISFCHLVADGTNQCRTNTYNGLTIDNRDESGRQLTRLLDPIGRLWIERTTLGGRTSDATYEYGNFDLLEHQNVNDSSGATHISYDVLGRPTQVRRTSAGAPRGASYNAFGEVIASYKIIDELSREEEVTYGYDPLGRVTSATGVSGMDRRFYWDLGVTMANGQPGARVAAPNGLGKLVDVLDVPSGTFLHNDYNANGLRRKKSWTFAQLPAQSFAFDYVYDGNGRIDTLTYPAIPGESAPLAVKYGYDPFTGTTASLRDAATPTAPPLWSATARNEWGQISTESMVRGGPVVTRASTYYLPTGQLKTAVLSSAAAGSAQAQLSYTYQADGLPWTFGMSGVGGTWKATYDYDNLGRITSWQPDVGAPTVAYRYDDDGNLRSRSWSGETVTFTDVVNGPKALRVTTSRTGQTALVDQYTFDYTGRIWETPTIWTFNREDDRITSVLDRVSNRQDFLAYDGTGQHVMTLIGGDQVSTASFYRITLDGLFEMENGRTMSAAFGRCRLRANGRVVGDLIRSSPLAPRAATFYLTDGVGSVVAEASSEGAVSARRPRDPFGNSFPSALNPQLLPDPVGANPDGTSRYGFAGHSRDQAWGVVDMVARHYNPRIARFMTPDTVIGSLFDRVQHNALAYAWNRPTALTDPSGHLPWEEDPVAVVRKTAETATKGGQDQGSPDLEGGTFGLDDPDGELFAARVATDRALGQASGAARNSAATNVSPGGGGVTQGGGGPSAGSAADATNSLVYGGGAVAASPSSPSGADAPRTSPSIGKVLVHMFADTFNTAMWLWREDDRIDLAGTEWDYTPSERDAGEATEVLIDMGTLFIGGLGELKELSIGARAVEEAGAATRTAPRLLPTPRMMHHHIFPRQHRGFFERAGIDLDDFTIPLSEATHLRGVHGKGLGDMPGGWNARWQEFKELNPNATAKDIFQFGGRLIDEFGLGGLPIVPYPR